MMEGRRTLAGTFLVFFLLIGFTRGQDALKEKGIEDPRRHPNLSPFQEWRSAYDCLQNTSSTCPEKYQLTPKGWVNVTTDDSKIYCERCKDHTLNLLSCLEDVMRLQPYKFESDEKVADINYTIAQGCSPTSPGFTGRVLKASEAGTLQGSKAAAYISVVAAWLLTTYITI